MMMNVIAFLQGFVRSQQRVEKVIKVSLLFCVTTMDTNSHIQEVRFVLRRTMTKGKTIFQAGLDT